MQQELFHIPENRIRGTFAKEKHARLFKNREKELLNSIAYLQSMITNFPVMIRLISETVEEQRAEIAHLKNVIKLIKHK
jgi:hypothetical protein